MTPSKSFAAAALIAALTLSSAAMAQHAPAETPKGTTVTLQGAAAEWIKDPHWHAVYDLTVAAFAHGPDKVDVDAYETKSFAIFRDFGKSMGMDPAKMQDHLKLIPRQMVRIVREDPKVLDSYQNFIEAGFGPQ